MKPTESDFMLRGFLCGYSLAKAIERAGGDISMQEMVVRVMEKWSLKEFLTNIAIPNGVHFTCLEREDEE